MIPKKRLEKLEKAITPPDTEIHVYVCWYTDAETGVEYDSDGKPIPPPKPGEKVIRIRYDDSCDKETD